MQCWQKGGGCGGGGAGGASKGGVRRGGSVAHDPKLGSSKGVHGLVEIAEGGAAQGGVCVGGAAAQDVVVGIKEVGRVLSGGVGGGGAGVGGASGGGVRCPQHREQAQGSVPAHLGVGGGGRKAREGLKGRGGPLPPPAAQLLHAVAARSSKVRPLCFSHDSPSVRGTVGLRLCQAGWVGGWVGAVGGWADGCVGGRVRASLEQAAGSHKRAQQLHAPPPPPQHQQHLT